MKNNLTVQVPRKSLNRSIRTLKGIRDGLRKKVSRKRSTAEDFFNFGAVIGILMAAEYLKENAK